MGFYRRKAQATLVDGDFNVLIRRLLIDLSVGAAPFRGEIEWAARTDLALRIVEKNIKTCGRSRRSPRFSSA